MILATNIISTVVSHPSMAVYGTKERKDYWLYEGEDLLFTAACYLLTGLILREPRGDVGDLFEVITSGFSSPILYSPYLFHTTMVDGKVLHNITIVDFIVPYFMPNKLLNANSARNALFMPPISHSHSQPHVQI